MGFYGVDLWKVPLDGEFYGRMLLLKSVRVEKQFCVHRWALEMRGKWFEILLNISPAFIKVIYCQWTVWSFGNFRRKQARSSTSVWIIFWERYWAQLQRKLNKNKWIHFVFIWWNNILTLLIEIQIHFIRWSQWN